MYLENSDTVLAMKAQTTVVSRNEIGIVGPALSATTGNVKIMLVAGAICVMPWNTSSERPSELRRSCGDPVFLVASAVTRRTPSAHDTRLRWLDLNLPRRYIGNVGYGFA